MKVFISWSGEMSHKAALALEEWLPQVINAAKPFVSSEDIEKGQRWNSELEKELEQSDFGIVVLTPENINRPWLNFEAGALSKKLGQNKARVCPLLLNLNHSDLTDSCPLKQFQATKVEKNDFLRLLKSVHNVIDEKSLTEQQLEKSFSKWWPDIENKLKEVINTIEEGMTFVEFDKQTKEEKMLDELLGLTRLLYMKIMKQREFDEDAIKDIAENCIVEYEKLRIEELKYFTKNRESSNSADDDYDKFNNR